MFYVSIRRTEDFEFDIIRTAGVSGNATNYEKSQGDNAVCSTRDEISQPSRPIIEPPLITTLGISSLRLKPGPD